MKVLIVDDELLTIKNLKYSFEQDNYEVESTGDSNEALKKITTTDYDIIILDLVL
ncbi:MAG TPA: DNA-binding response regulator, partial [Clostridiales bacterium]|nr:DNA-binding response regulator [Clostridiales bacterium]